MAWQQWPPRCVMGWSDWVMAPSPRDGSCNRPWRALEPRDGSCNRPRRALEPRDGSCNSPRRALECSTLSTISLMTISWAPRSIDMGGGTRYSCVKSKWRQYFGVGWLVEDKLRYCGRWRKTQSQACYLMGVYTNGGVGFIRNSEIRKTENEKMIL